MSERSLETNKLRADLEAGHLMEQALHQARQAYLFSSSTYTYECLNAVQRLKRQLQQLLRPVTGEDIGRDLPASSPQQETLLWCRSTPARAGSIRRRVTCWLPIDTIAMIGSPASRGAVASLVGTVTAQRRSCSTRRGSGCG
jgi:hypothetical protein